MVVIAEVIPKCNSGNGLWLNYIQLIKKCSKFAPKACSNKKDNLIRKLYLSHVGAVLRMYCSCFRSSSERYKSDFPLLRTYLSHPESFLPKLLFEKCSHWSFERTSRSIVMACSGLLYTFINYQLNAKCSRSKIQQHTRTELHWRSLFPNLPIWPTYNEICLLTLVTHYAEEKLVQLPQIKVRICQQTRNISTCIQDW